MHISIAAVAGLSLLLSSCVVPYDGYGTFTYSTNGYSSSVAWTSASYDANGFPIYGYYYGRPVYGYTSTGAAIFTIAALTALCFVPDWGPAPWYHGHWHYPAHIHHCAVPPHHAPGHHPGSRPHGGLNAPIHKNPHHVLGKPEHQHNAHRPQPNNRQHMGNNRPNVQARPNTGNRPNAQARPNTGNRPNVQARPNVSSRPNIQARPNVSSRPAQTRPHQFNRVSGSSRPSGLSSHSSRPSAGRSHAGRRNR